MIEAWLKDTGHKIIVMMAAIFLLGALVGRHFFIEPDFKTLKDFLIPNIYKNNLSRRRVY